jgi:hypothetical protein
VRSPWFLALAAALAVTAGACRSAPEEPLKLERNLLTVDNRTSDDWKNVEIWVNTYYRVTVASIASGSRFQAPLDAFVAGYGQRFNYHSTQIRDVRLTATGGDGKPFELKKQFAQSGLAGAVGGTRGGKP